MAAMTPDMLNEKILEAVSAAWEKREPILLSELGQLNDGQIGMVAKELNGRLSSYIETRLSDRLLIIRHSRILALVGVIPCDKEVELNQSVDVFLEKRTIPKQSGDVSPRFRPSFWAAFRKTLEYGHCRYIDKMSPNRFYNIPEKETPPEGTIEIKKTYIASSDVERDSEIIKKIEQWCKDHQLPTEIFQRSGNDVHEEAIERRGRSNRSALDILLDALDDSELRKLTFPMDVVKKLSKRV